MPEVASSPDAARGRPDRWRVVARTVGELLVTGGLVVLLFVFYELFVTDWFTEHRRAELTEQRLGDWDRGAAVPRHVDVGEAFAVLHIPRLGADYSRVVLEGTNEDQLKQGPGHYVGTAMPGERGNVS